MLIRLKFTSTINSIKRELIIIIKPIRQIIIKRDELNRKSIKVDVIKQLDC